ncbi:hypothetical protein XENOCAPTIV_021385 [Xenoophorus captivus]|uniref:Uncharacterized protein n=1 Tax=Xenoophorus captivus TaxID=1517983 RepID=A0ABV0S2Q6_9TELE
MERSKSTAVSQPGFRAKASSTEGGWGRRGLTDEGLDRLALLNTAGNLPDNPTSHSQKIERAPLCRLPVAISEGFSSPCSRLYITHSGGQSLSS